MIFAKRGFILLTLPKNIKMLFLKKLLNKKYSAKQIKKISYWIIWLFLFFYLVLSYFIVFRPLLNKKNWSDKKQICIENNCFDLQFAKTPKEIKKWLMFQENLSLKSGMLFIFPNSWKYPFWMKNTLIPLDIIWLDKNYKVVDIKTAQPCKLEKCPSFFPSAQAKYVLEINAWLCEKFNIKIWKKLTRK